MIFNLIPRVPADKLVWDLLTRDPKSWQRPSEVRTRDFATLLFGDWLACLIDVQLTSIHHLFEPISAVAVFR